MSETTARGLEVRKQEARGVVLTGVVVGLEEASRRHILVTAGERASDL